MSQRIHCQTEMHCVTEWSALCAKELQRVPEEPTACCVAETAAFRMYQRVIHCVSQGAELCSRERCTVSLRAALCAKER